VSAAAKWHELEETYHYVTTYAPELLSASYTEARGARVQAPVPQAAQKTTGQGLSHGGDRRSDTSKGKLPLEKLEVRAKQSGVSPRTQRDLDWLARKAPEHLERVRAGESS
jgi:hypothetical protein